MKRCPQCEFIYEDDQSLCDMDGILLVFDSTKLPKPKSSSTSRFGSHWRNRIVPTVATLVLATVLSLVYYVATHQQPASHARYTPAGVVEAQILPTHDTSVDSTAASTTESEKSAVGSEPKPREKPDKETKINSSPLPTSKVVKEPTEKPKSKSTQKTPSPQPEQQDSKIGSLIKKTGRILKKPFKF